MRRRLVSLATALVLVVTAAAPAGAITNDYRPDDEHPFVGLVAFYNADWEFQQRCSGSLVTPTVMVMAGHCVDNGEGGVFAHARAWFLQDVGSTFNGTIDPRTGYADSCTGTLGNGLGIWCAESDEMYNFGNTGFPDTHDFGLVILDQPIALSAYATLAVEGALDTLFNAKGVQDRVVRVSGFGISAVQKNPVTGAVKWQLSFRVRLQADAVVINTVNSWTDGYNVGTQGNGSDRGGTCSGDSGGPVFWPADSNRIVAVTSFGRRNSGCKGVDFAYRTDRAAVLEWIEAKVGPTQWSLITVE